MVLVLCVRRFDDISFFACPLSIASSPGGFQASGHPVLSVTTVIAKLVKMSRACSTEGPKDAAFLKPCAHGGAAPAPRPGGSGRSGAGGGQGTWDTPNRTRGRARGDPGLGSKVSSGFASCPKLSPRAEEHLCGDPKPQVQSWPGPL